MSAGSRFSSINRSHFSTLFITLILSSTVSISAYCVSFESGEFYGSLDTTISVGTSSRVARRDNNNVGIANGGTSFSTNSDNGNLNYGRGIYSTLTKFTTELDLNYKNFGLFFRGNGFKDFESQDTDRTPLTDKAERLVNHNVNIQDLYLWGDFDIGEMPLQVRVGEQVLSWGESTFIQNSINTINPADVSKLRTPGSELKDALTPIGMVWASLGLTENISVEGYYQYDYERIIIDPQGSYFSTNDIAGPGGNKLFLGFGDVPDLGTTVIGPVTAATSGDPALAFFSGLGAFAAGGTDGLNTNFDTAPRSADDRPGNGGEFGAALRFFAPKLNDTEFGLFFVNYHSRLPIVSITAPTAAAIGNAGVAAVASNLVAGFGAPGAAAFADATFSAAFGADNGTVSAADSANCTLAAGLVAGAAVTETALSGVTGFTGPAASYALQCVLSPAINGANYFIEYPEDIQLLGLSFNTQLTKSGIALQGEYSFRHDVPLQIDIQEVILAAGTSLNSNFALNGSATVRGTRNNQITNGADLAAGDIVTGFILRDVSQAQVTATKVFGPTLNANTAVLVGEIAVTHIHNMPDKDVLRLEAPGTNTTGNPFHSGLTGFHPGKAAESEDNFADATSWGYQIRGQLQYLNAIGAINVLPRFAWRHDVGGISPGPGGNFLEERKAISLGVGFTYQNDWKADLGYTNFFGADGYNALDDRDFIAFSISRSF